MQPKPAPQRPTNTLKVVPLRAASPRARSRVIGRPRKDQMPTMPEIAMSTDERDLYDFFITSNLNDNPDLTSADKVLLALAGLEYIKYLRLIAQEMESGEMVSMAKQHPYSQMRGLMDSLSVTRKARKQAPDSSETEAREQLKKFFS